MTAQPKTEIPTAAHARCLGRDDELRDLVGLVEGAVREGVGRVVVLSGEPGIGKSRLCAALAAELATRGVTVLQGHCRDGIRHAATYRPFVEIVDGAIAALLAASEHGVAERGREVHAALAGRAVPGAVGSGWAERRAALFDAVTGFLVDASRLVSMAIFVHDLDAADLATRELVVHLGAIGAPAESLASGGAGERLRGALVLSARTVDESLFSGAAATSVALRALDSDGVRAFLQSPEVVSFFAEATGGRPRALEALLESAPLDADELLHARWTRLDDNARRLASALTIAGKPLDLGELGLLAGVGDEALALSAHALESSRLVRREVSRGRVLLSFLRRSDEEAVHALTGDVERATLHLAVGRWLAGDDHADVDDLLRRVRIAEHLLSGGAGLEAIDAAMRAVDALEITYGYDRAIDLLRRARAAAVDLGLERSIAHIDERLCELERLVGDFDAALVTARRVQQRSPGAASHRRIAALHVLRDELDQALGELSLATQLVCEGDLIEPARIAAARAEALYLAGRTAQAKEAAEAALVDGDDAEAPLRHIEIQNTLGKVALAEARYADAAAIFEENVVPARSLGNAFEESRALFNLGIAELRLGDHVQAQSHYQAALEIAESVGDHRNRAFCLQNLGVLSHWRGDYAQALGHFQAAVAAFRRTGLRARLAWVALDLASVYLDLNDRSGASATASVVTQLGARSLPPEIAVDREVIAARIAALGGAATEARAHAENARIAAGSHQQERSLEASQLLVRLDLDANDLDGAAQHLASIGTSKSERIQLRTDLLRGELFVALGRGLDARRLLRDALESAQRIADLDSEWRAQYWLGRAAQSLRDNAEAERRMRAALAVDRRLRDRVPEAQRAGFEADPIRRALENALGLSTIVQLPVATRPQLVDVSSQAPLVGRIVGRHPSMVQMASLLQRVAPSDSMVLIRGESGTGKELVAEALHEGSARRNRTFVKVNCGAIVESLLLSELFGHERGAFTGALARKKGRFEVADGGTIFLDEIGDITPRTQVALLRVLQERQFERVGGTTPVRVDVRIVCATHRNLEEMVARGEFREDLYYRLRGIVLELPPLRDRRSDVPLLAKSILAHLAAQRGHEPWQLTDGAEAMLTRHPWPGNVRELENVLRSATLFAEGSTIGESDLGELVAQRVVEPAASASMDPSQVTWARIATDGLSLKELKTRVEIECIERALDEANGNITRAAERLGMKRPRLSQLIKEHGLRTPVCTEEENH